MLSLMQPAFLLACDSGEGEVSVSYGFVGSDGATLGCAAAGQTELTVLFDVGEGTTTETVPCDDAPIVRTVMARSQAVGLFTENDAGAAPNWRMSTNEQAFTAVADETVEVDVLLDLCDENGVSGGCP
jgi:hypothetical protein